MVMILTKYVFEEGRRFDDFEDEDGCQEPDNDQDGFADANDACPNVEDYDADRDEDGCPEDKDKMEMVLKMLWITAHVNQRQKMDIWMKMAVQTRLLQQFVSHQHKSRSSKRYCLKLDRMSF